MATEHWFRWHHGTVNDPKWRIVATRARHAMSRHVTVAEVLAVWSCMVECASQANPRGQLQGWCDEDIGVLLELDEAHVAGIRVAMQGKTLDDNRLTAWEKRQPKREREDPKSTDRKRAQRERDMAAAEQERRDNQMSHHVTPRGEERREEEKEQKQKTQARPPQAADGPELDDPIQEPPGIDPPIEPAADAPAQLPPTSLDETRAKRLAQVTADAVTAYNAVLGKPNGKLAAVHLVNEVRAKQVKRCLDVAREISKRQYEDFDRQIPAKFWTDYFTACDADPWLRGDVAGSRDHQNYVPDFELLTRADRMTAVFDKAISDVA